MTIYRRVLGYLKPYWHKLAASMFCSIMFSLASGMSIYLTIPLLETLFVQPETGAPVSQAVSPAVGILPSWLLNLKDDLSRLFRELVFQYLGLSALAAYIALYRRHSAGRGQPAA